MNISNIPPTFFSSEDNRKRIETISNINTERLLENVKKATTIDTDKMIENFKIATTIDTDKLVESVKLAPKINEIISRNDIQAISNKFFQQYNFSETIQNSVIRNVSNSKIRLDTSNGTYKIKPMSIPNKEVIKDYTPILDYAIKWNERTAFGIEGGYSLYSLIGDMPTEFFIFIGFLHLLIALVLVNAKHNQKNKLEQNEKE